MPDIALAHRCSALTPNAFCGQAITARGEPGPSLGRPYGRSIGESVVSELQGFRAHQEQALGERGTPAGNQGSLPGTAVRRQCRAYPKQEAADRPALPLR